MHGNNAPTSDGKPGPAQRDCRRGVLRATVRWRTGAWPPFGTGRRRGVVPWRTGGRRERTGRRPSGPSGPSVRRGHDLGVRAEPRWHAGGVFRGRDGKDGPDAAGGTRRGRAVPCGARHHRFHEAGQPTRERGCRPYHRLPWWRRAPKPAGQDCRCAAGPEPAGRSKRSRRIRIEAARSVGGSPLPGDPAVLGDGLGGGRTGQWVVGRVLLSSGALIRPRTPPGALPGPCPTHAPAPAVHLRIRPGRPIGKTLD